MWRILNNLCDVWECELAFWLHSEVTDYMQMKQNTSVFARICSQNVALTEERFQLSCNKCFGYSFHIRISGKVCSNLVSKTNKDLILSLK